MKGKKLKGRHKFICDVCGMEYGSEHKKQRWDGAIVCKWDWEPRHPQDLIKAVKEDTSVKDPRPEPPDVFVDGGVYATGATESAGGEGSWTPADSIPPATLDIANQTDCFGTIVIQPDVADAWGTGSYITLGNGEYAEWNGTKWIAYAEDYQLSVADLGDGYGYNSVAGEGGISPATYEGETIGALTVDASNMFGIAFDGLAQPGGATTLTFSKLGMTDLELSWNGFTYASAASAEWQALLASNVNETVGISIS